MGQTYTIEVPDMPPTPNTMYRLPVRERIRLTKRFRDDAEMVARAARIPAMQRARITYTLVYPPRAPFTDPDGVPGRIKLCLDGIVRAGVLPDDNHKHVVMGLHQQVRGPKRCVRIEIERLGEPDEGRVA